VAATSPGTTAQKPECCHDRQVFCHYLAKYAHWPNNDPIGQMLDTSKDGGRIVALSTMSMKKAPRAIPAGKSTTPDTQASPSAAELVLRTTLPPATLAGSVLRTLRDINPKQTVAEFKPIQTLVNHANSSRQFFMLLVASFAALGMLLAAIGIYGVISYSVTQRTKEIGIRMALGATRSQVQISVLAKTFRLAAIGIAAGAIASLIVSRAIAALLFNTAPERPLRVRRHGGSHRDCRSSGRLPPSPPSLQCEPHGGLAQQLTSRSQSDRGRISTE
jgi:hypothetical protein